MYPTWLCTFYTLHFFHLFDVYTTIIAAVARPTDCCSADAISTRTMDRISYNYILRKLSFSSLPIQSSSSSCLRVSGHMVAMTVYLVLWSSPPPPRAVGRCHRAVIFPISSVNSRLHLHCATSYSSLSLSRTHFNMRLHSRAAPLFSPRVIYVYMSMRTRETQWKHTHKNTAGRPGDESAAIICTHIVNNNVYAAGTTDIHNKNCSRYKLQVTSRPNLCAPLHSDRVWCAALDICVQYIII